MAGVTATRSRRRQAAAHADRARPSDAHVAGRANKHHRQQDVSQSKPKSADAAKAKAEQEYMERLAKEFSSLPDRDVPQGESSGSNQFSNITPRPNSDSMTSTNVAITKTIRTAIADMKKKS